MNQSVKQGILIIITILLIASLITLFYFYLTTTKGYFADTEYVISHPKAPNDRFSDAEPLLTETVIDIKSSPPLTSSSDTKSPPSSTASMEHFGDDKSLTPVVLSDDNKTSYNKLPSSNKQESSLEPTVKEMNNIVKVESPNELPQSVTDHIKTFVLFVGHGRSGHSIIGSLMDSHPHMVVSHEYDLFTKLSHGSLAPDKIAIFNALWKNTRQTIISGLRAKSTDYKGYTLFVDGLYQGKYVDHIDVIGDKKGGTTSELLAYNHEMWLQSFNIVKSLNLPIKVVYVIRNPYDNIATMVLCKAINERNLGKFKQSNETIKVKSKIVEDRIRYYFDLHNATVNAIKTYNLDVIEIHSKDFISNPKGTLLKICTNLGVTCNDNYLEICNNNVYKRHSRTRHMLEWTEEQLNMIQQKIDEYSILKGYNFYSM